MEVITIESRAFKKMMAKLDKIEKRFEQLVELIPPVEVVVPKEENPWLNGKEVCELLRICNRTLQRLRSDKLISYSVIRGKFYYKREVVVKMLNEQRFAKLPQNESEDLHLSEKSKGEKKKCKETKLAAAAKSLFAEKSPQSDTELCEKLQALLDVKECTAKSYLRYMRKKQLIINDPSNAEYLMLGFVNT